MHAHVHAHAHTQTCTNIACTHIHKPAMGPFFHFDDHYQMIGMITYFGQAWSSVLGRVGSCATSATIWVISLQDGRHSDTHMQHVHTYRESIRPRHNKKTLDTDKYFAEHTLVRLFWWALMKLIPHLLHFMGDLIDIDAAVCCRLGVVTIPALTT